MEPTDLEFTAREVRPYGASTIVVGSIERCPDVAVVLAPDPDNASTSYQAGKSLLGYTAKIKCTEADEVFDMPTYDLSGIVSMVPATEGGQPVVRLDLEPLPVTVGPRVAAFRTEYPTKPAGYYSTPGEYRCMHDGFPFRGRPYCYPVTSGDDETKPQYVRGTFCSPGCAKKALLLRRENEQLTVWLSIFYIKYYGLAIVTAAPEVDMLDCHGGPMSLAMFRAHSRQQVIAFVTPVNEYPFVPEPRSISTKKQ